MLNKLWELFYFPHNLRNISINIGQFDALFSLEINDVSFDCVDSFQIKVKLFQNNWESYWESNWELSGYSA